MRILYFILPIILLAFPAKAIVPDVLECDSTGLEIDMTGVNVYLLSYDTQEEAEEAADNLDDWFTDAYWAAFDEVMNLDCDECFVDERCKRHRHTRAEGTADIGLEKDGDEFWLYAVSDDPLIWWITCDRCP